MLVGPSVLIPDLLQVRFLCEKNPVQPPGTEEDRVNCPFYFKIGACRNGHPERLFLGGLGSSVVGIRPKVL